MINRLDIFEKAHLPQSSNLARKYFEECGLKISEIKLDDCEKLSKLITSEIKTLLKDKTYHMVKCLKMRKKIKKDRYGIYLFVDGVYFIKRLAIEFSFEDSKINFCTWASGCNRIPFIRGFINWCDWMKISKENNSLEVTR